MEQVLYQVVWIQLHVTTIRLRIVIVVLVPLTMPAGIVEELVL